jgi:putative sterol carrier protein
METIETEEQVDVPARLEEIFQAFQVKGAAGAQSDATFVFELEGEHGGRHLLKTGPEAVVWEKDYAGEADVVLKLSAEDFLAMADGNFDGRLAVASERIELEGDRELAETMLALIEPEQA